LKEAVKLNIKQKRGIALDNRLDFEPVKPLLHKVNMNVYYVYDLYMGYLEQNHDLKNWFFRKRKIPSQEGCLTYEADY
jgi:hypothetical protein